MPRPAPHSTIANRATAPASGSATTSRRGGEPFLKGGSLVPRPESYRHSPNYPDSAA